MGQIKVTYDVGGIEGLCIIESTVHQDSRGYFMETFNQKEMYEAGIYISFVQDNQSMSKKGVLRGLHFQKRFPQTKLVRVIKGIIYDVAVDLRIGSPTFSKHHGVILTADNKKQYLIPRGFAHGFLVLILTMRVGLLGMIRRLGSSGRNSWASIAVQPMQAVTIFLTALY